MSTNELCYVGGEDVEMRIPLLKRLKSRGFSVSAVGSRSPDPFHAESIRFANYQLNRGVSPISDQRSKWQLASLFRDMRPQIVHAFDTKPSMLAMFAAKSAAVPVCIRTITGMGYVFSSDSLTAKVLKPVYRALQKRAASVASFTIFQNPDDQAYFLEHGMADPSRQTVVLGSGIDVAQIEQRRAKPEQLAILRRELGIDQEIVITMVSRLIKSKGVIEFLQAARRIKQSLRTPVRFLLVGPCASESKEAVSRATMLEYEGDVQYLGKRDDVETILDISDIFVLPSYREGVPRVLLEAGAKGVALVTTNTPGCKEVVQDYVNGLIVEPKDVHSLAGAISKLIEAPELCRKMGLESIRKIKNTFDLSLVAEQYASIYARTIDEARHKGALRA